MALKLLEGTIKELLDLLRHEISQTTRAASSAACSSGPAAGRIRARLDPDTYGGAYLLGLRGLAVVAHGNSGRRAVANAIALAARGVEHRVVERLAERLPARPPPERAGGGTAGRMNRGAAVYDRRAFQPFPRAMR